MRVSAARRRLMGRTILETAMVAMSVVGWSHPGSAAQPAALGTTTVPSSRGWHSESSTRTENSGSSSKDEPRCYGAKARSRAGGVRRWIAGGLKWPSTWPKRGSAGRLSRVLRPGPSAASVVSTSSGVRGPAPKPLPESAAFALHSPAVNREGLVDAVAANPFRLRGLQAPRLSLLAAPQETRLWASTRPSAAATD